MNTKRPRLKNSLPSKKDPGCPPLSTIHPVGMAVYENTRREDGKIRRSVCIPGAWIIRAQDVTFTPVHAYVNTWYNYLGRVHLLFIYLRLHVVSCRRDIRSRSSPASGSSTPRERFSSLSRFFSFPISIELSRDRREIRVSVPRRVTLSTNNFIRDDTRKNIRFDDNFSIMIEKSNGQGWWKRNFG